MIAFPSLSGLSVFLKPQKQMFLCLKWHGQSRAVSILTLYESTSKYNISLYLCMCIKLVAAVSVYRRVRHTRTMRVFLEYNPRKQITEKDTIQTYETHTHTHTHTDAHTHERPHLLVLRHDCFVSGQVVCVPWNPHFSHGALLLMLEVSCVSCVVWNFLPPPGLQLTPLLMDTCPFSIS